MSRLIVSFSLLLFVAIVSIGGCNGGGGGDGTEPTPIPTLEPGPTPEPTPPPDLSEACLNCPCDFFSIPLTSECWVGDTQIFLDGMVVQEFQDETPVEAPGWCVLGDLNEGMYVSGHSCSVGPFQSDTCNISDNILSKFEVADCRTCLGEYATELNDSGISVSGGPPYTCFTPPPGPGHNCDFMPDSGGAFYTEGDCIGLANAFGCVDFSFQGGICEVTGCEDCLCNATSQIAEGVINPIGCVSAGFISNCFNAFFDEGTDECNLLVCVHEAPCGPFDEIIP